jgi:glycosidase
MKYFYLTICFLFLTMNVRSQVVTTDPSMVVEGVPVTITFNADEGTGGLEGYSGDVYAHTGVITDASTSDSDWKYVVADWGVNLSKAKLTRITTNQYQLSFPDGIRSYYGVPDGENILKIALVFRSGTTVGGVYLEGKETGGNDIFVSVYELSLTVGFQQPTDGSLFQPGESVVVSGSAIDADGLRLYLDDALLSQVTGTELSYTFSAPASGSHLLKLEAYNSIGSVYDEIRFFIRQPTVEQEMPEPWRNGVNYLSDTEVAVVLQAPDKEYVYLLGDFNNWEPLPEYQMLKDGDFFWLTVDGLTPGQQYAYQFFIDGELRLADPYANLILDPWNDQYISETVFPNLKDYPTGLTEEIVSVLETDSPSYQWQVTDFAAPSTQNMTVYELLIRDFTDEGTIAAVAEKLDYIQGLGVDAVELMPFNEFEGNDSWGYNPSFYFAPDKAYGTPDDYKAFIDACHQRGIAVIMDVVLNHSYGQSPLVQMYWDGDKPAENNPWYNVNHNMQNPDAQWGYDFNHESIYTQALVDSILSFWMSEYKIDGFRFDFTKGFTNTVYGLTSWASEYDASRIAILKRMVDEIRKRDSDAIVVFEHLADNTEETELADYGILLWGNHNYNFSEGIMGYNSNSDFSWASYLNRGWSEPSLVSYMESHDEERVTYKALSYGDSYGDYDVTDLSTALQRDEAAAVLLLSVPGPKMIWQFGELGYDVSIDEGGRLAKKPTRWTYLQDSDRVHLLDVYQRMNWLRNEEAAFSTSDFVLDVTGSVKYIRLNSPDNNIRVVANLDLIPKTVTPSFSQSGWWYEYFSGDSINVSGTAMTVTVEPGGYRLYSTSKMVGFDTIPTLIEEPQSNQVNLELFPNPVSQILKVNSSVGVESCTIYTVNGVAVFSQDTSESQLNVSALADGLYLIKLKLENGQDWYDRFVKIH